MPLVTCASLNPGSTE